MQYLDLFGVRESRLHAAQLLKRANHQAGADQQHERERHLHHDQRVARPVALPALADVRPTPRSAVARRGSRVFHNRDDTEEHARRAATHRGRTPARSDRCRCRAAAASVRTFRDQDPQGRIRQAQTHRAAEQSERHAFDEHRPRDSPPAGAERSPDRELLLAGLGADEQQIGHVRAGDQQHQPQRPHHHPQRRADVSDDVLLQRLEPGREASVLKYRAIDSRIRRPGIQPDSPTCEPHRRWPAPW